MTEPTAVYVGGVSLCLSVFPPRTQVAELVTSEFFEQGDRERSELKLTPSVRSTALPQPSHKH